MPPLRWLSTCQKSFRAFAGQRFPPATHRAFSTQSQPSFERAELFPLQDNEHIAPTNIPALPFPSPPSSRLWVSSLSSSFLRPKGWHAFESTIEYPYTELTGRELRTVFVSKEDPSKRGFFKTGLTVSAYTIEDREGVALRDLRKIRQVNNFVNDFLIGNRLLDPERKNDGSVETHKDIEVKSKTYHKPNRAHREGFHITRVGYEHKAFAPEGLVGMAPEDMHFEVEWWANDLQGCIFELAFQAPSKDWDLAWNEYGKQMMTADEGHFLCWNRDPIRKKWDPYPQ